MSIFRLSLKNVFSRPLSLILTVVMLTMGVALTSLLILIGEGLEEGFKKNIRGIDMVVGAKGSPLQLILSSIYHIDNPTGNISRSEAEKLAKNRLVDQAIQLSFGDSYKGFRIVGTEKKYIDLYNIQISEGRVWEGAFEAVVGNTAAANLGLKLGDEFYSAHGVDEEALAHEDHPFKVVGILEPGGTVADRLILTAQESVWEVHSHDGEEEAEKEITAMLITFKNKIAMITLPRFVNEQTNMQAALPSIEVNRLFELFGIGISTLRIIGICFVLLGAVSVFVSLLNSLRERSFEMAWLRAMGSSRGELFWMIITEALIVGILGLLLGIGIAHSGLAILSKSTSLQLGMNFDVLRLAEDEWIMVLGILLLCILAAILPAIRTLKKDVSQVLATHGN